MNSYPVKKTQCPKCATEGRDTSKDNLVTYSDGHSYCFSCGYYSLYGRTKITSFKNKLTEDNERSLQMTTISLPEDCSIDYPLRALNWISKYELSKNDLLTNNVFWSESEQRLIFPIYGEGGVILGWQGRSFHENLPAISKVPKWWGRGISEDVFNYLGKGNKLVLCEDIISAIKIAKSGFKALPLYGSNISKERLKRVYNQFKDKIEVYIWLDYDKASKAPFYAKLGRVFGLHCCTIITEKDPKEYSIEEIQEILSHD